MSIGGIRTIALFVALALMVVACGSGEEPDTPTASVPVATDEPTVAATDAAPTEAADPFAIPAEIDEAYVERVLEELSTATAAAARIVARRNRLTPEARDVLASSYRDGSALDGIIDSFRDALRSARGEELFNENAERIDTSVRELLATDEGCVFARVRQDSSDIAGKEIAPFTSYIHIEVKRPREDPDGRNRTPWMIVAEVGPPPKGKSYEDPCAK